MEDLPAFIYIKVGFYTFIVALNPCAFVCVFDLVFEPKICKKEEAIDLIKRPKKLDSKVVQVLGHPNIRPYLSWFMYK